MSRFIKILLLLVTNWSLGQAKTPEEFGYRHIVINYKNDKVDVLIKSKKGEENVQKRCARGRMAQEMGRREAANEGNLCGRSTER